MRRRRQRRPPAGPGDLTRVLVISASMGAGHDGAARELATRLRAAGHSTEVKDFLESGPLRIGSALRSGYEFELKHIPSAYEATYRLWYRVPWLCPAVAWLVTFLTHRRVLRWVEESEAEVVVSTYPLATLCLGRLRWKGRLHVPAVNFITDFGVHPLWVHKGIDVNLAVHDGPAQMAADRTGLPGFACGPVVSPAFSPGALPDRDRVRRELGLSPDDRAVLVVAGSWGVGGVENTWSAIAEDGRFVPVVVCGRDERLRRQFEDLAGSARSIVLGWRDDMPALMAACDALVENAGGLTSLEAMRAGLPVVSFQPIAGHGRENTTRMAAAGVSMLAADRLQLVESLRLLTSAGPVRTRQLRTAQAMFRSEAADLVLDTARAGIGLIPAGRMIPAERQVRPERRRRVAAVGRCAAAVVAVAGMVWAGLTAGVDVAAAAAGAGVAHPAANAAMAAYVGVRLSPQELADSQVTGQLARMHLTAVVDSSTAMDNPRAVRALAAEGVDVESGGHGAWETSNGHDSDPMLWTRARADALASKQLSELIGAPVNDFVPGRRVNAWDLIECHALHSSLVVPDHTLNVFHLTTSPDSSGPIHVDARQIYLVNGLGASPVQLTEVLGWLAAGLDAAGLNAVPLAALV